jgi:hypothetical protein
MGASSARRHGARDVGEKDAEQTAPGHGLVLDPAPVPLGETAGEIEPDAGTLGARDARGEQAWDHFFGDAAPVVLYFHHH